MIYTYLSGLMNDAKDWLRNLGLDIVRALGVRLRADVPMQEKIYMK